MAGNRFHSHLDELNRSGVVLLPGVVPMSSLQRLAAAVDTCFDRIRVNRGDPLSYRFSPYSQSFLVSALLDFGCSAEDLTAPLAIDGLEDLIGPKHCGLEQSWIRKRYAPSRAPAQYQPNSWHQDGGLGVRFTADPAVLPPMTELLTCWLPLDPCGWEAPGLEFVRRPLDRLLHYTELDDPGLRRRFAPENFWAPQASPGDALLFLNGTLHRTYVQPDMPNDRRSVEYRFFR